MGKELTREQFHKGLIGNVPKKWHKKMLAEFDKDMLEKSSIKTLDLEVEKNDLIHKAMNNLNTFQCCEGELYLRGTDEYGKDFQVVFCAYDFLNWIDSDQIEYIKEQLIKHIKTK